MKLSNTAQYAIRILNFMAHDAKNLYSAKYLIEKLNISDKYLRRIMTKLAKVGLIVATQGREGGYQFQRKLNEIFVIDIINAIEDTKVLYNCVLGFNNCNDEFPCALHSKWVNARKETIDFFHNTSLAEISLENSIAKF